MVSRTVGQGRVVDELVASFTHNLEIPAILPGVPPTGRRILGFLVSDRGLLLAVTLVGLVWLAGFFWF